MTEAMNDNNFEKDPDLGEIKPGHVCKHGIRWPHPCQLCDDLSYMTHIQESIAKQPIDPNESNSKLAEETSTLMKKVFAELNKPNGVLFKRDDGNVIVVLIVDGKWDWDNCKFFNMEEMTDKYDDVSAKDPFEFVFLKWDEENMKMTTMDSKSVVPNYSMSKLFAEGKLQKTIEKDYENRYGFI